MQSHSHSYLLLFPYQRLQMLMNVFIWLEKFDITHQERDTASRQTTRTESEGKKWAIGRSASSKIREGFGFKRAVSTGAAQVV